MPVPLSVWAGSLLTSGLAMGRPRSWDSSFPVLETRCAVSYDFLCVQINVCIYHCKVAGGGS